MYMQLQVPNYRLEKLRSVVNTASSSVSIFAPILLLNKTKLICIVATNAHPLSTPNPMPSNNDVK